MPGLTQRTSLNNGCVAEKALLCCEVDKELGFWRLRGNREARTMYPIACGRAGERAEALSGALMQSFGEGSGCVSLQLLLLLDEWDTWNSQKASLENVETK